MCKLYFMSQNGFETNGAMKSKRIMIKKLKKKIMRGGRGGGSDIVIMDILYFLIKVIKFSLKIFP